MAVDYQVGGFSGGGMETVTVGAYVDGEYVGGIDAKQYGDRWFSVVDVEVSEDFQRQGIATAMVEILRSEVEARGCILIHSDALTPDGRAWAESTGIDLQMPPGGQSWRDNGRLRGEPAPEPVRFAIRQAAYGYDDDFWPEDADYPEVEYRIGNDVAILYRGVNFDPGWSLDIPDPDGRTDWTWAGVAYDDDFYVPHVLDALGEHVGRHWSFSRETAENFAGDSGVILTARVSGAFEEIWRGPKEEAGVFYREDDEQEVFLRENVPVDLLGMSIRDAAEGERSYWLDLELPQRMEVWASKPLRGYHVTLKEYLPSIMSQGLAPRSQTGISNYDSWLTSKDDRVYLAENLSLIDGMLLDQIAVDSLAERWLNHNLAESDKGMGFEWMELTRLALPQLDGLTVVALEVNIPPTYWDSLDYDEDYETFGTEGTWSFVGTIPPEWISVHSEWVTSEVERAIEFLQEHGGRSYDEVYGGPIASRYASDSQEEFESKAAEVASRLGSGGFDGRLGRCYELAAKEVCYGLGGTLVHGTITNNLGNGRTIDHAWVERDNGMIFDAVLDDEYTPATYEYFYGPNPMFRYTQEEALINLVETENWGPWEDVFYDDGRDDEF